MTLPKFDALENFDEIKINNEILKAKKELLFLRIQKSNFSKISPHLITHTKHQISQLMTFKRSLQKSSVSKKK